MPLPCCSWNKRDESPSEPRMTLRRGRGSPLAPGGADVPGFPRVAVAKPGGIVRRPAGSRVSPELIVPNPLAGRPPEPEQSFVVESRSICICSVTGCGGGGGATAEWLQALALKIAAIARPCVSLSNAFADRFISYPLKQQPSAAVLRIFTLTQQPSTIFNEPGEKFHFFAMASDK